eukprot:1320624-Rhodomonas_salina.3
MLGYGATCAVRLATASAHGGICLRARYAMSGMDATGTTCSDVSRYAMSGTDLAYAATRRGQQGTGEVRYLPTRALREARY